MKLHTALWTLATLACSVAALAGPAVPPLVEPAIVAGGALLVLGEAARARGW